MASSKNLKVDSLINEYPENSGYLIAYSGGADSSALLHLFAHSTALKGKLRAIHVNHGISSKANQWQAHCQNVCKQLNISLICKQLQLNDTSENTCRLARYDCFRGELNKDEILLTGHHNQDQAETVIMKLVRGSGMKGLSGIERIKPFASGFLARPLLSLSPESLKSYLLENNHQWIEDDSNLDNDYRRNHIRNKIIPDLQYHWPKAIDNISRTAENVQNSMELLRYFTQEKNKYLSMSQLLDLPESLRPSLIYHWLADKKLPLPNKAAIEQMTKDFIQAGSNKNPHFVIKQYRLQRWKNRIYCLKNLKTIDSSDVCLWQTGHDFELPNGGGRLIYKGIENLNLTIKFNQKGQKLQPCNHSIKKSVKNLFQEHQVPLWQRQLTPFIYYQDELISIGFSWGCIESFKDKIELKFNNLEL